MEMMKVNKEPEEKRLNQCQFRKCENDVANVVVLKSGTRLFYCEYHTAQAIQLKIVVSWMSWKKM